MAALTLPSLFVESIVVAASSTRPVLVNRDPGAGETGVPLDTSIAFELVDPGSDGIDRAATRVWVQGTLAFDGVIQPGFDGPGSGVVQTADTLRIVLVPPTAFASEQLVNVRVASHTNGGAHTLDEVYTFQIEDRTAPRPVGAIATGPRSLRVSFNEPVRVADATALAIAALAAPAVPVAVVEASALDSLVEVRVVPEMTPGALYQIATTGVVDPAGNPALPPDHTVVVAGFRQASPPTRRFDLWAMLPRHNRRTDATGDLARFIACLQELTDLLLVEVDRFSEVFDLERAPEAFLDLILRDLGNPFPFELDTLGKRRLASSLVEMYRQKGTAVGIKNAIRFFLGIDVEAITGLAATSLILGESELGVDWELGPSDRFARYAFDVHIGRVLTDQERRHIRAIVEYLKPAHTHFVTLVEPVPPPTFDHWELGVSDLGDTSVLH